MTGDLKLIVMLPLAGDWIVVTFAVEGGNCPRPAGTWNSKGRINGSALGRVLNDRCKTLAENQF